ncbi:unnamed protein product [Chilo suppressalis]|uniref:Mutant cadherin n=1 Tax=Chilo suppressalis TaxID=168631 RepID=A0ABN8BBA2_CHISP|nr:unnamed protein product [Chilo suppressalis]
MSSQQLIANELLAFIENAIDTMDEISILQICNFKEDEVCSGKALIFRSVGKTDQMPSRRRDGTAKSLQNIVTLLKELDPDDVPTFVSKELHKLPPVTLDHVDVTRLLKDINFLKTNLADVVNKLEESNNTTVVIGREAPRPAPFPFRHTGDVTQLHVNTKTRLRSCGRQPTRRMTQPERKSTHPKKKGSQDISCATPTETRNRNCDDEGFITVERKKRKPTRRNLCGVAPIGPNNLLRPAVPVTLLYVSGLHYTTKAEGITCVPRPISP